MVVLYCLIMLLVACVPFYVMMAFLKSYDELHRVLEENEIIFCDLCRKYFKLHEMLRIDEKGKEPIFICKTCLENTQTNMDN